LRAISRQLSAISRNPVSGRNSLTAEG